MPGGWNAPGRQALQSSDRLLLEHAKHDSADKGECDIRGNNANPVDEGTGENHGEDSLVYVATSPNA
jgi:hypothetical protein